MSASYSNALVSLRTVTHTEELDVVKNVVVEGEIIARDNIDAGLLLYLPVGKTETLALSEKVFLGQLSAPVGFSGFLEVTVYSHTGETEDRSDMVSEESQE